VVLILKKLAERHKMFAFLGVLLQGPMREASNFINPNKKAALLSQSGFVAKGELNFTTFIKSIQSKYPPVSFASFLYKEKKSDLVMFSEC